jgi:hypothetical protein|tara:strand:+ start:830 stop:1045 length:216 start_codon:yes stop_codon:yes gene_type:complete
MAIGTFTAAVGVPILLTPLAEQLAAGSGFSLEAILMLQALSFSTSYLVYQNRHLLWLRWGWQVCAWLTVPS